VFAFKTRAAASEAKKEWMSNLATKKNEARKK
jgi:hypothetical protein